MQVLRSRIRTIRIGVASTRPSCEHSREPSLEEPERPGEALGHRHRTGPVLHAEQCDELSRTPGPRHGPLPDDRWNRGVSRCADGQPAMPFTSRGQQALRAGKGLGRALRRSADRIGVFVLHGRLGVSRIGG
jgi:hypothetical protein